MRFFRREPPDHDPASPPNIHDSAAGGAATSGISPLAPLPAPKAERLDRNKLSILAAFAGMAVIAMVVFMQPAAPNTAAARGDAPVPQGATYLDQPMRSAVPPSGDREGAAADSVQAPTRGAAEGPGDVGAALAPGYGSPQPLPESYAPAGRYGDASAAAPASHPTTLAELRAAAYRRALDASPTGEDGSGARPSGGATPRGEGPSGVTASSDLAALPARDGTREVTATTGGAGGVSRAEQFMQTAALASNQRAVQALTVQAAPGPYSVQAGTVIPAVFMTEINSDLPGECLAQITRDVYDSRAQRFLLVPRGSKLLCRYDDQLATGQSRLLVAWTRLLLPDGRSVSLPGLPATDGSGARGVSDQVDRHAKRAFGTAAALSIIGAGVQLAQPQRGSILAPPSAGQVMAGALGQELNQVAVEMLRRDLSNRQTIRIRQGVEFNVFLNTDLTFPGPYATTRTDGGATAASTTAASTPVPGSTPSPRER